MPYYTDYILWMHLNLFKTQRAEHPSPYSTVTDFAKFLG